MKLIPGSIKQISDRINEILNNYSGEMQVAADVDGTVKIGLGITLVEDGPEIQTKLVISFIRKGRVKDETNFTITAQQELFE